MSNALSPASKPYVELGSALGTLAATLLGQVNNQTRASITTEGTFKKFYTSTVPILRVVFTYDFP